MSALRQKRPFGHEVLDSQVQLCPPSSSPAWIQPVIARERREAKLRLKGLSAKPIDEESFGKSTVYRYTARHHVFINHHAV